MFLGFSREFRKMGWDKEIKMYIYKPEISKKYSFKSMARFRGPKLKRVLSWEVIKSNIHFLILLALKMAAKVFSVNVIWRMKDLFYMLKSTAPTKDF